MKTSSILKSPCPRCGKKLTDVTSAFSDSGEPEPGDITLCIQCACAMVFNDDLSVHAMTEAEFDELDFETIQELARVLFAIKEVKRVN